MNVALEVEELIHIAELLRVNLHECQDALEANPVDITAKVALEKSKSCLVKITVSSMERQEPPNEKTNTIFLSGRPKLN